MYFLIGLFWLIPLIFSHIFARFWRGFILDNGIGDFESLKMQAFLILLVFATFEMLVRKREYFVSKGTRFWVHILFGVLTFLTFSGFFYQYFDLKSLLFGVGEKQHGILMILWLFWLGILLSFLNYREKRYVGYAILVSGFFVAITTIIEFLGYNIFTGETYSSLGSWGEVRSTSTLGNPNYVAWFLLILLPLVFSSVKRGEKYILFFLFFLWLCATKSMIGIALGILYSVLLLGKKFLGSKIYLILPFFLIIGITIAYWLTSESEKWLSLLSRFVLMKHTMIESLKSGLGILFGYWPDAVIQFFSSSRAEEISSYFPTSMIIDSSHNIFIDAYASYGIIGIVLITSFLFSRSKNLDIPSRHALILGFGFLSLNVYVISHLIVLLYYISLVRATNKD